MIAGFVEAIDALAVGKVCHALGCGRTQPGQPILYEPGVVLNVKPGDIVNDGDVTLKIHHDGSENNLKILQQLDNAVLIEPNFTQPPKLVLEMID